MQIGHWLSFITMEHAIEVQKKSVEEANDCLAIKVVLAYTYLFLESFVQSFHLRLYILWLWTLTLKYTCSFVSVELCLLWCKVHWFEPLFGQHSYIICVWKVALKWHSYKRVMRKMQKHVPSCLLCDVFLNGHDSQLSFYIQYSKLFSSYMNMM